MSESTAIKICQLCGEDCSDRPRVRDAFGKMFCRVCFDCAMAQMEQRRTGAHDQSIPFPGPDTLESFQEPDPDVETLPPPGAMLDELIKPPPRRAAPRNGYCPECETRFRHLSVICVQCGFDRRDATRHEGIAGSKRAPDLTDTRDPQGAWSPDEGDPRMPQPTARGFLSLFGWGRAGSDSESAQHLPIVEDYGRFFQKARHHCHKCRGVMEIRRRLPNRSAHRMMTLCTLGLWLPAWLALEFLCRTKSWRCVNCRCGVRKALLD